MPSGTVEIPIRVESKGSVPLYLQIKYQVTYLISSGLLPERAQLPPVRVLASELNINPNTVAQAYKELQSEGLVVSYHGRGSFVRPFSPGSEQAARRLRQLSAVLQRARSQARALGFSDSHIVQHFSSLAQQEQLPYPLAFVATMDHIAEKYARLLERHLEPAVAVTPCTLDDLAEAAVSLEGIHFVLTFARLVPALEERFGPRSPHHVLGIATEVTAATVARLAALDPGQRHILLTEERFLHSSLNLIQDHSPLAPHTIACSTDTDPDALRTHLRDIDVVLYTFSRRELVAALSGERHALELVFDISRDSVAKLRKLFPASAPEGTTLARDAAAS